MNDLRKVSVVVPCFNAERFIAAALRSVYAQDWSPLEVIVVDDGSTDSSATIVEENFPQAVLIRQANRGVAGARNAGIARATGEMIAFLDADDCWLAGKLRAQMQALGAHPSARMCYGAWLVRDTLNPDLSAPAVAYPGTAPDPARQSWDGPSGWIYGKLLQDCEVWTSTVIARRSLFEEIGGFDESLQAGEDWDLWLRASRATEIIRVAMPLAVYRQHDASLTRTLSSRNYGAEVISNALARWGYASPAGGAADPAEVRRALARSWVKFGGSHVAARNWAIARRAAVQALKFAPLDPQASKLLARALMHIPPLRSRRRPSPT